MVMQGGHHISMFLEASGASPEEELLVSNETGHRRWGIIRPALIAIAVFALVAVVLLVTYPKNVSTERYSPSLRSSNPSATTMLQEIEDPCQNFPFLDMKTVLRSNLGHKGPDFGAEEGLVFEGFDREPGKNPKPIELHLNVVSDYNAFHPARIDRLGFYDGPGSKFMGINLDQGTEVTLKFTVTEPGKTVPIRLDAMDLTFFDLDSHKSGNNKEFVKAGGFTNQLTYEGTKVQIIGDPSDVTYSAPQNSTEVDNPTDPTSLTELQLQHAISLEFEGFTETTVTFGSTKSAGGHQRRFDFVGRPSIKCATGVDPAKVVEFAPTCCVLKIGYINCICTSAATKQWYHFMC